MKVAYLHGDDLISQYRGNDIHYYHYDGLGSTRGLTDQNAVVTDAYNYEAFGELLEQTGETENNYLYTGEQIDPNTGNYYLRARYYNPVSGRFLSMDSFAGWENQPLTLHKYLYANADPINNIDPSGKITFSSIRTSINIFTQVITNLSRTLINVSLNLGRTPTGYTFTRFYELSLRLRTVAGKYGRDIRVHGSRAAGGGKNSDIDIAIRVSKKQFDRIIKERFNPNPGSSKWKTMQHAIKTGKIQRGELGLRGVGKQFEREFGMEFDISVILKGGKFDKGPWKRLL